MRPALWIALLASLATAGGLALQPDTDADDAAAMLAAPRQPGAAAPSTHARPTPLSAALPARPADWPAAEPGALLAWGAPPPPPPPAVAARQASEPPAPPRAPAFPYQWIGSLDDGSGRQALLGGALRAAALREGQVLDGQWRLDRVRDGQLTLTWLPGGLAVTVRPQATASRNPTLQDNHDAAPDS